MLVNNTSFIAGVKISGQIFQGYLWRQLVAHHPLSAQNFLPGWAQTTSGKYSEIGFPCSLSVAIVQH